MSFDGVLLMGLYWLSLALVAWALVDAVVRPATGYVAAGKLTKPAWVAILAVCVGLCLLGVGLLGLLGGAVAVATILYLVDVRPALRELGGPGGYGSGGRWS